MPIAALASADPAAAIPTETPGDGAATPAESGDEADRIIDVSGRRFHCTPTLGEDPGQLQDFENRGVELELEEGYRCVLIDDVVVDNLPFDGFSPEPPLFGERDTIDSRLSTQDSLMSTSTEGSPSELTTADPTAAGLGEVWAQTPEPAVAEVSEVDMPKVEEAEVEVHAVEVLSAEVLPADAQPATVSEAGVASAQPALTSSPTAAPSPLARLCCDAVLQKVVLDKTGVPIDVGRKYRTATANQWTAIRSVYSTCAWVGCDRPLSWCQLHHINYWQAGGKTDLDNLLPLCSAHHHLVHEGDWSIELRAAVTGAAGRAVEIYKPDGKLHTVGDPPTRRPQAELGSNLAKPQPRATGGPPSAHQSKRERSRTSLINSPKADSDWSESEHRCLQFPTVVS